MWTVLCDLQVDIHCDILIIGTCMCQMNPVTKVMVTQLGNHNQFRFKLYFAVYVVDNGSLCKVSIRFKTEEWLQCLRVFSRRTVLVSSVSCIISRLGLSMCWPGFDCCLGLSYPQPHLRGEGYLANVLLGCTVTQISNPYPLDQMCLISLPD